MSEVSAKSQLLLTRPARQAVGPISTAVSARDDLVDGFMQWEIWARLGWLEVKRRYRRTVIGPFWSAVSICIFVFALGSVGSSLFHRTAADYMPFLASGMVVWVLLSNMISESCDLFIDGANLFRQLRFNYSVLAYALVWRTTIGFLHNLVVYVGVALIYAPAFLSPVTLLVLPGLFVVALNGVWIALAIGMLCQRFRDVQQLVSITLQLAMFVTPIFWSPAFVPEHSARFFVVLVNPLYYLVEIVRAPLLGQVPSPATVIGVVLITVVGWLVTYQLFRRYRKRIAYWS